MTKHKIYSTRELLEGIYKSAGYDVNRKEIKRTVTDIIRKNKALDMIKEVYGNTLNLVISNKYYLN